MIEKLVSTNSNINIFLRSLENNEKVSVFGCGFGEKIALIMENSLKSVILASEKDEICKIKERLEDNNIRVVVLSNPNEFNINFSQEEYIRNLSLINSGNYDAIIVTGDNLLAKYPNKKHLFNNIHLEINEEYDLYDLTQKLIALNYQRVEVVTEINQFSVKGDVIDIFINNQDSPVRLFFEFGELNKIKKIDLNTLKSVEISENFVDINSNSFIELDINKARNILTNNMKKALNKEVYENALFKLETNDYKDKSWFCALDDNYNKTLFDYITDDCVFYIWDAKRDYDLSQLAIKEYNNSINEGIKEEKLLSEHKSFKINEELLDLNGYNLPIVCFQHITNANRFFKPNKIFTFKSQFLTNYYNNKKILYLDLISNTDAQITTILCCKTKEGANSLYRELLHNSVKCEVVDNLQNVIKGTVNIIVKNYYNSYVFIDEKLCVIGIDLLFGYKKSPKTVDLSGFDEVFIPKDGDFVVHKIHGIGKCLGLKKLNVSGVQKDYFVLQYKNDDKLFVPCENVDSFSKYVGSDSAPALNKMGGIEFAKVKQRVKQKVKEMAFSLVKLYAERQELKGYIYPKDDELQEHFENSFEFIETPDQLNAIKDIKTDMETGKVMDRLVCGDVGFGKTEVAMRCAFKTVCAGKMVAFLCPTTILSEQHYNSCLMRMKEFGVRIEVLNRFKSPTEIKKITKQLENGEIDIIVGTHMLLNKNIVFKNLGLLILDEEQKFGVEDKEKIKNMKKDVNILTLSATPIPRTLNMALSGIRDISVIQTPPTSRVPTEVKILDYNSSIIKSAIEKEIERGGQVLIIYNKVASIYKIASIIKADLDPSVRIGVAHGQMQEKELENEIVKLYNHETDVLVSTTLIENGVDLPNANTLIVLEADKLGLSQLYQLKGRIGRSDKQAYAYFIFDGQKNMSENAYKRLQAIGEFTTMGSGFKIAIRDLEIRGAGNVLGAEQHGHMQKVGYAMYVELLKQAIQEEKGEKVKNFNEVRIETNIPAFIPVEYIENYEQRIAQYVNISKIDCEEELNKIIASLKDVYGNVPNEVDSLCKIALIKSLANSLDINKIRIQKGLSIILSSMEKMNEIVEILNNSNVKMVLNLEVEPIIKIDFEKDINKLEYVYNLLLTILHAK